MGLLAKYDRLFGGEPGAAEKTRSSMRKSYGGTKRGDTVFWATVYKREKRSKRNVRKTKARRS